MRVVYIIWPFVTQYIKQICRMFYIDMFHDGIARCNSIQYMCGYAWVLVRDGMFVVGIKDVCRFVRFAYIVRWANFDAFQ